MDCKITIYFIIHASTRNSTKVLNASTKEIRFATIRLKWKSGFMVIRERMMTSQVHIFGSVHAMKTKIPPLDSMKQYLQIPDDSFSQC